ncbi:acireductone synthase [Streptomyces sp. NPDC089919]|uniref:acireductone synthase n=1 Tax=Streptomyces sp. NPDC089919 TaxID=3155188 RepID=UPI0034153299
MTPFAADSVVLDVEGTTSATGFVTGVLYPYARERMGAVLRERAGDPRVVRAVAQVRELLGEPAADTARIEAALESWLDEDRKATPLKTLQGVLWAEGFARGELVPHFYPDVLPALRRWHAGGLRLHVYSSGSVAAQRAWFGHTAEGDLLGLLDGLYDTENAGPKTAAASYRTITGALGTPPGRTLFLSDRPAELDAAREAGWLTLRLVRPGEPHAGDPDGAAAHPRAGSFDAVGVAPAARALHTAEDGER